MHKWEKAAATATVASGDRYERKFSNPSFSSTLLDEIYRSIDEGEKKIVKDLRFYGESMLKKQSNGGIVINGRAMVKKEEEEESALRGACLIEKWMDKKVSQKVKPRKQDLGEFKRDYHDHHDRDALFFSTTSTSSDSSSGGFSSSDTDPMYRTRSKAASCFAPMRPKPVRTSIPTRPEKTERTMRTLLCEQRELHMFDDYHCKSATGRTSRRLEENLIKSKSRAALKIYGNLRKMKQPISPGAKVASFISSLFTTGSIKKSKNNSSPSSTAVEICREDRKSKAGQESACSSASSFSRPCLSEDSPSTRETLRNGVKRTVRCYPVSVIVDDKDRKPCGHKRLNEQKVDEQPSLMSVSLPTAWKIGKSPSRRMDDEHKHQLLEEKRRTLEETAREFPKDYHQIEKQNDLIMRGICRNRNRHYEDVCDDDNDATSYSSSDLFELDHLSLIGNDRHCQELPVYETTRVDTNC
uniref:Protein BIG GRAIN 1-like A n=1 Tax=Rhizophora mucronata TaxID=61149 RepID=A0A2P2J1S1_RHIMU